MAADSIASRVGCANAAAALERRRRADVDEKFAGELASG
jgi:hypothetical protein